VFGSPSVSFEAELAKPAPRDTASAAAATGARGGNTNEAAVANGAIAPATSETGLATFCTTWLTGLRTLPAAYPIDLAPFATVSPIDFAPLPINLNGAVNGVMNFQNPFFLGVYFGFGGVFF